MPKYVFALMMVILTLVFVIGCGERMTKEQLFALGEKSESEEKYEEAIKTYEKLVKNYPQGERSDEAQYKIALIYYNNLNDFEKSVQAHEKLITKYPSSKFSAQSLFMMGFINANNISNLEEARKYYEEFLQKYPDNELVSSVKWELEHLGKDINEIEFLNQQSENEGVAADKEKNVK
ncbi:tetratricopeptide repeat protein [candidate division KSB1 bacterium]|nr:tetratricopeptide repeat protein [candidate division KSB1 bacterium]